MLIKYIVAAALIFGAASLYWLLRGLVLLPVRAGENAELKIVLSVSGEANELEHTLKGLIWLRENGTLKADIEIMANAPTDTARLVAAAFLRDYHYISYTETGEA